jgi:hypothetical protein
MGAARASGVAAVDQTTWYRVSGPADVGILLGDVLPTRSGFVLAPDAIPPAVGCRTCGRWHYPHRVEVVHDDDIERGGPDGTGAALILVCPRCHTQGPLCSGGVFNPIASSIVAELSRRASCAPNEQPR